MKNVEIVKQAIEDDFSLFSDRPQLLLNRLIHHFQLVTELKGITKKEKHELFLDFQDVLAHIEAQLREIEEREDPYTSAEENLLSFLFRIQTELKKGQKRIDIMRVVHEIIVDISHKEQRELLRLCSRAARAMLGEKRSKKGAIRRAPFEEDGVRFEIREEICGKYLVAVSETKEELIRKMDEFFIFLMSEKVYARDNNKYEYYICCL